MPAANGCFLRSYSVISALRFVALSFLCVIINTVVCSLRLYMTHAAKPLARLGKSNWSSMKDRLLILLFNIAYNAVFSINIKFPSF